MEERQENCKNEESEVKKMEYKSEDEMKYAQEQYLREQEKQRNFERNIIISLVALVFQSIAMLITVINLLLRI